ncbi:MAG: glycosyltransferase family 2 protein [Acidobacteriota bacterium]
MEPIRVVAVSPVHNRRDETLQCLKSLNRLNVDGLELRVIIVDDGSTDGTSEAIRDKFPDVEIVAGDGDLWYTAGTNRGIEAALLHDPKYIWAVNNDSIFDEQCLKRMVDCAESNPKSIVGALLLNWETPHKVFQVAPKWDLLRGGIQHWRRQTIWTVPEEPWEVELVVGNCVLYPAVVVREVGLMDERRLPQFGDAEYTPRMRRRGWRLFIEPCARVFCKPNDEISGFRHLSINEKIKEMLVKKTGPYSLRRRIYGNLGAAPTTLQALIATPIFYIRVLIGKNSEGKWGSEQPEAALKEVYRPK